jgi:hypothetical protein
MFSMITYPPVESVDYPEDVAVARVDVASAVGAISRKKPMD